MESPWSCLSALFLHLSSHPRSLPLKGGGRRTMTTLPPTEPTPSTVSVLRMTSSTTTPTPLLPHTATTCPTTLTMNRRCQRHFQLGTTTTSQEVQGSTVLDISGTIQQGLCLLLMLMCLFCTRHLQATTRWFIESRTKDVIKSQPIKYKCTVYKSFYREIVKSLKIICSSLFNIWNLCFLIIVVNYHILVIIGCIRVYKLVKGWGVWY